MQRGRAAESDHRAIGDFLAALDRMHPGGRGHVLVDDFDQPQGGAGCVHGQGVAKVALHRAFRALDVQLHAAAGEILGIDPAQQQVGVRHRRLAAAAAVAGGTGIRPGAFRTDLNSAQGVDRGDRPATGADFHHFDDRNFYRQAAALHEPVGPVDLETAGQQRFPIVDQADLRGRAAHIEGQNAVLAQRLRDRRG